MTVSSSTSRSGPYVGAGTVGPFVIDFRFIADSHLEVIKTEIATGIETTLTLTTDYSVTGTGNDGGGELTLTSALSSSYTLTIQLDVPITQELDYLQSDAFPAQSHEDGLDKLTQIAQILNRILGRTIRAPEAAAAFDELPAAATRANRTLGFDSSGNPTILTPADGSAASVLADLASTSDVALGDALVAVKRTEANAIGRTLHFYVQHSKLMVSNYCDPTVDSAAAVASALAAAIAAAQGAGKVLEFDPGATYTTNAETTFMTGSGIRNMRFWGNGCTIYRNTGAGPVATFDSGAFDERNDNHEFIDFVLKGNAASTYGLYTRGLARSKLHDIRFVDIATAGMLSELSVLNDYQRLIVSDNIDTFTVNPTKGIILDRSAVGFNTSVNTFLDCVFEGPISNVGIDLTNADGNTFIGGSCEAIARGTVIRAGCSGNNFIGTDFEANSVYDIEVLGKRNAFTDCIVSSAGSSGTAFMQSGAVGNVIRGGYCRRVNIDAGAIGTRLFGVSFNDDGANGIQGTGAYQSYGCVKVDSNYAQTSLIDDVSGVVGSYTATLTGCTTSPTAAINYRRQGDLVTLEIPSGFTATSNTTACTLTGMPSEIRPSATRSDIGIVTDNSANVIGRFEIDSGGTITLRNGAGAAFTGSGTKGAQASTITYKV